MPYCTLMSYQSWRRLCVTAVRQATQHLRLDPGVVAYPDITRGARQHALLLRIPDNWDIKVEVIQPIGVDRLEVRTNMTNVLVYKPMRVLETADGRFFASYYDLGAGYQPLIRISRKEAGIRSGCLLRLARYRQGGINICSPIMRFHPDGRRLSAGKGQTVVKNGKASITVRVSTTQPKFNLLEALWVRNAALRWTNHFGHEVDLSHCGPVSPGEPVFADQFSDHGLLMHMNHALRSNLQSCRDLVSRQIFMDELKRAQELEEERKAKAIADRSSAAVGRDLD